MQTTYRPPCRVRPSWWSSALSQDPPVPVPFIDEDEATMAVTTARALLDRAHLAPAQLRRIVVSSRTGSGLSPLVADALGVMRERVEEGAALLYGQTRFPAPGEGPVLQIQSDAPRPGGSTDVRHGAYAIARLAGPGLADAPPTEVPVTPWEADRETVQALSHWEREAPRRTTMAAYVPRATWDEGAGARYRLEGSSCAQGHVEFPPRTRCGSCGDACGPLPLARRGRLLTFTVIAKGGAPTEFEPLQAAAGEYAVGIAEFGGARVPGLFCETPVSALEIGTEVEPVFRRLYGQDGEWRYGSKFRLAPPVPAKG